MATLEEVLERAAQRVEAGWTQWAPARGKPTPYGDVLSCADPRAERFCASGAIARASMELVAPEMIGFGIGPTAGDARRDQCALASSSEMEGLAAEAVACVVEVLMREGQPHSLIAWNDWPGRTQAEVVAALRTAAERSRSMP